MRTRNFRMRTLVMIVLLLIGGAIINVAVAWGCVLLSREFRWIDTTWPVKAPAGYEQPTKVKAIEKVGTTKLQDWVMTDSGYLGSVDLYVAGWPKRCLYAERHYVKDWAGIPGLTSFDRPKNFWDGIAIPSQLSKFRSHECFPTRPLWRGFIINTLLYFAILWLTLAGPFLLRRRWRHRKRLCLHCAYPIGASDTCTECGRPVKRKMIAQKAGAA